MSENLAVAEHVNSLSPLADGFRLVPDVPDPPADSYAALVAALAEGAEGPAATTLSEIQAYVADAARDRPTCRPSGGSSRAHPKFLAAEWAKHQLILSEGEIPLGPKLCAAMAVAMNKHSAYWASYLNPWVRQAMHLDDDTLVELGAAVVHSRYP